MDGEGMERSGTAEGTFLDARPICQWPTCPRRANLVSTVDGVTKLYCVFHYEEQERGGLTAQPTVPPYGNGRKMALKD